MDITYQIKESVIYSEVNRAIKKGLVGKLTSSEFNKWCIEWWLKNGLDENCNICNDGKLRDPYTGYIIDQHHKKSQLVLEHIIPIDRDGGTVIFNVVPSRSDINSSKSNNDPLEWWLKSGFFNKERFKVFVNYIFDAYDKRIKDGIFRLEFDNIDDDNNSYNDCIEELNNSEDFKEQSSRNNNQIQLKKINYGQFLSSCIVLLESIDNNLANTYSKKLKLYEEQGIFNNISLYQQIQSIIFRQIKKLDSAKKYEFLKKINIDMLFKSLSNVQDLENEIHKRIDKIVDLIQDENSSIRLNDLLFAYPNIICITSDELSQKVNAIRKYDLGNEIMLLIKNNSFLLSLQPEEIPIVIKKIRDSLGEEYFNIFINTSLKYDDVKILNYIQNCTESRLLKNLKKQNSDDTLDVWLKENTKLQIYGTFINTLSIKITNRSFKYTNFNNTIKQTYISSIVNLLYEYVEKTQELLKEPEKLKSIIHEIIWNILPENIEKMKLFGNDINEQRNNLFDLFCKCIDDNLIQNYIYLEQIKNKKLLSLEISELMKDIEIVKKYILDATNLSDLSLEKLNSITKDLPNIGLLNGNFTTRIHQKIIYVKNPDINGEQKKQLYISKKDVGLITERLVQKINFTKKVDNNFLKSTVFALIKEETLNNKDFFSPLNYLSDNKKINVISDLFYKEIDAKTLQSFLMLEQLLRQKKEQLSLKKENEAVQKKQQQQEEKQQNRIKELQKAIYYIDECTDISQLRFENINKIKYGTSIPLNEWINRNIKLDALNLNKLNRSFEKSLVDRIRSGSTKYSKKNIERELITIVIEQLNLQLNFWENPSKNVQKEVVNKIIASIITNHDLLNKFDGYKGITYEEKIFNFRNLIYKFIEDGSIETYLLLDQKVKQKKQQLYIDSQSQKIKRSA